jgi:hypothetical protein
MAKDETSAHSLVTGGSATGLSATDAWAEPLSAMLVNLSQLRTVPGLNQQIRSPGSEPGQKVRAGSIQCTFRVTKPPRRKCAQPLLLRRSVRIR